MVDKDLLMEMKEKLDAGSDSANIDDTLKVFELYDQLAQKDGYLKEEIEEMELSVQLIINDRDKKFWVKVSDGKMNYGEGEFEDPSFTFSTDFETGSKILFGEIDATSAYMAGDITVEGNLADALAFQEIIELSMETFEEEIENL